MYFWKLEIPSEDAQVLEHVISTKIRPVVMKQGRSWDLETLSGN